MNISPESLRGGYSQEDLERAFALVKPTANWKDAISALVPADADLAMIAFAVGYFTGSLAETYPEGDQVRVIADGYYAAVGA